MGNLSLKDAEVLVLRLKTKYPNPKRIRDALEPNDCCVGGAFLHEYCAYAARTHHVSFPSGEKLAAGLMERNTRLHYPAADDFATEIIRANDRGQFEKAYQQLRKALSFPD